MLVVSWIEVPISGRGDFENTAFCFLGVNLLSSYGFITHVYKTHILMTHGALPNLFRQSKIERNEPIQKIEL